MDGRLYRDLLYETYATGHAECRFRFVDLANDINEHMPRPCRAAGHPGTEPDGLSAGSAPRHPDPDGTADPTYLSWHVEQATGGRARVQAVDGHVAAVHLARVAPRVPLTAEALRAAADAVVVLTDHDNVDYPLVEREASWILDCRNRLTGPNVELL